MKPGHFIIIGQISWITLSLFNSFWIYKSEAHILAAIIVGLGSIIWLSRKENRSALLTRFSSRPPIIDNNLSNKLLSSIQIGLIAIFSLLVVGLEVSKFLIRKSEGYAFMTSEILKDKEIKGEIGEVKYIAIKNKFSSHLSFSNSEKRLKTNLLVFGDSGQVNVDIDAVKNKDWRIESMKIVK